MRKVTRFLIPCSCLVSLFLTMSQGVCRADDEPAPPLVGFGPTMFGDFVIKTPDGIVPGRGAYKISENESPQPQDRVFVNYNHFNHGKGLFSGKPLNTTRETIGLEKTLLKDASVGLRLPFVQRNHLYYNQDAPDSDSSDSSVDDLSLILKYAPLYNRTTGSALSFGLTVTAPTGERARALFETERGRLHPWLMQPYIGYLWNRGALFVQGFDSIMVPTDTRDVTVVFNDVGAGLWLARSEHRRFITAVIPTLEIHVNTPVNHRSESDLPRYRDSVDLTAGVHVEFNRHGLFGVAVVRPLNSPRTFEFEVIASFNYRF